MVAFSQSQAVQNANPIPHGQLRFINPQGNDAGTTLLTAASDKTGLRCPQYAASALPTMRCIRPSIRCITGLIDKPKKALPDDIGVISHHRGRLRIDRQMQNIGKSPRRKMIMDQVGSLGQISK